MRHKLIIDGNAVYEIDDDCLACLQEAGQGQDWNPRYTKQDASQCLTSETGEDKNGFAFFK